MQSTPPTHAPPRPPTGLLAADRLPPEIAAMLDGPSAGSEGPAGVCVWFTGLPCSGKTTTAEALAHRLQDAPGAVAILDGDVIRACFSGDLGFSKADRDANVHRVGGLAAQLVQRGGIVICALVSPYAAARGRARELVGAARFVEVFVDTPLAVAEARDVKGLYAKARRGEIRNFTGIDDPYEPPTHPELTLDTVNCALSDNVARLIRYLETGGWLPQAAPVPPAAAPPPN